MVDLVDKGEAELQQLTQKVAMTTSSATFKASVRVGKGVAKWPFKSVAAIFSAVSQELAKSRQAGQVSLKAFTQIAQGKREVLNIDDKKVSKALERELLRHGVVWSVERHTDGSRTFHVQGKDAELVQHALATAAAHIDEQIAKGAPELAVEPQAAAQEQPAAEPQRVAMELTPEEVARVQELRGEAPTHAPAVPTQEPAAPSLANEKPAAEVVAAPTQRAAQEVADAAPSRSADRPELTPRDRTRAQCAERIDKKVQTKQAEQKRQPARTKKQTQSRGADEAIAPKQGRR